MCSLHFYSFDCCVLFFMNISFLPSGKEQKFLFIGFLFKSSKEKLSLGYKEMFFYFYFLWGHLKRLHRKEVTLIATLFSSDFLRFICRRLDRESF